MRSPTTALLWAAWRLTRGRIAFIVVILLAVGSILLAIATDDVAGLIASIALILSFLCCLSSRLLGQRSGFPFQADFAHPVRTWNLVAVPLVYLGVATAGVYVLPLIVLGAVFDVPFPLWPSAGWIGVLAASSAAGAWWTTGKRARDVATMAAPLAVLLLLPPEGLMPDRERWSEVIAFDVAGTVQFMLVAAGVYAATLVGVERQRRGGHALSLLEGRGRLRNAVRRLARLRRFGATQLVAARCPSSSPTRAELWLEMKYRGASMLLVAAVLAAAIPVFFWTVGKWWGPWLPLVTATGLLLVPLLTGAGASLWGGARAWSTMISGFEAARPVGTARLIGLQVLVIVACTVVAWAVMGASIWASLPLLGSTHDFGPLKREAVAALTTMPLRRLAGWAAMALVALATAAALLLSFKTLAAKHGKRLAVALLVPVLVVVALMFGSMRGWLTGSAVEALILWAAAVSVPAGTIYLFRRTLLDRILTVRHAVVAVSAWVVFAAIYVAFLQSSGTLTDETPARLAAFLLSSSLLPLAAFALAPWSLGLIRHS